MYGIYTNIGGILMVNVTIYNAYMDPMGIHILSSHDRAKCPALTSRIAYFRTPCSRPDDEVVPTQASWAPWLRGWSRGDMDHAPCRALLQCGAPKIAKLVNITPITMVYGTYNELVTGAYKPTYNWGASHC